MPITFSPAASGSQEPLLLNKIELAARYRVKVRTVDYWLRTKLIPVIKLGKLARFHAPDCDKIILSMRRPARSESRRKIPIRRKLAKS